MPQAGRSRMLPPTIFARSPKMLQAYEEIDLDDANPCLSLAPHRGVYCPGCHG